MRKKGGIPFCVLSLKINHAIIILILCFVICFIPRISKAQRGLGFKGLVPPAKAKQKEYSVEVSETDLPLIRVIDAEGHHEKVFVGPPYFLQEKGFNIYKGQRLIIWAVPVKVEGDKVLVSFKIKDKDTKQKIILRDNKGEPIWWGGRSRVKTKPGKKDGAW